jgi:CBS domain containing-hemolysin-like protein
MSIAAIESLAFVGDQLAGHPREGDCLTCAGLHFEIIDMDRASVNKVLVERAGTSRPMALSTPPA